MTLVHVWHHCHECDAKPIVGKRYHCTSCPDGPDNDLCEPCYEKYKQGTVQHPPAESYTEAAGITEHCFQMEEGKPLEDYKDWLDVPHPQAAEPKVPAPFVVRPIFNAGFDSTIGGYAFAVTMEGFSRPLLLTGLHVMDELIIKKNIDPTAKNKDYSGKELPAIITDVNLFDVFAPNWMMASLGDAGPMLVLPDARSGEEEPYSDKDIAAFHVHPTAQLTPASLAKTKPAIGDPVWLLARPEQPGNNLFKAVVLESTDRSLVYKFETKEELPKYGSGSPIIDKNGQVAGITIGGGQLQDHQLGHANHAENIRKHLESKG